VKKLCIFLCIFSCYNSITAMESERPSAFRRVRSRIESQDALQQQRTLKKAKPTTLEPWPKMVSRPFGIAELRVEPTEVSAPVQPPAEEQQVLCPTKYLGPKFVEAYSAKRDKKGSLISKTYPSLAFKSRGNLLNYLSREKTRLSCPAPECFLSFSARPSLMAHMKRAHPGEAIPSEKTLVSAETMRRIKESKRKATLKDNDARKKRYALIWEVGYHQKT